MKCNHKIEANIFIDGRKERQKKNITINEKDNETFKITI